MNIWKKVLVHPDTSILTTLGIIDKTAKQIAIVIDNNFTLLGTVTDGDIRRGLLKGITLESPVEKVMNTDPVFALDGNHENFYQEIFMKEKIRHLPIVDKYKRLVNIIFSDDEKKIEYRKNIVILMVGGLGERLRPLTNNLPKPLLKVGNKPILETIIEGFKQHGFYRFILCVNYKKEMIKSYFQDGSHLGIEISYINEEKKLGTAGALSLMSDKPEAPFFVMNGDLLTKINFDQMLEFHLKNASVATMCVREYEYQIPYGVIELDNYRLASIEEKPIKRSFVNAGIYILEPDVLKFVPKNTYFDMPDLFKILLKRNARTIAFPIREYWMDIGQLADYEKAKEDYNGVF